MVDVGIVDIPGSTSRSSFTTVVSPLQLALDGITCYAWSSHRLEVITMEPGWNLAMEALTSVLRRDLPREIVSHIAITIAVIHWRQMSVDDRNGQFSVEEQEKVTQLLAKRCFDVDKSKSILQNVALALQMTAAIPTQSPNSEARLEISRALFLITCDLFQRTFSGLDTAMHYPYLAEAILRLLDDNGAHHSTIQTHVAQVLPWCPDGDWVSPLHSEFGGELMTLLRSTLKTSSVDPNNPTSSPSSLLLEKMARVLDDSEFLRAIELMVTAKDIKAIRRLVITSYGQFAPEFVIRVVKYGLNDECSTRVSLLEAQVTLVAATLINWRQVWSPVQESVIDFFNHLLAQNTELQWPAYFTFMGLVSSSTSEDYPFPLNSVEPSRIRDVLHGPNWKDDLHQPWCGEAFLLLWRKVKQERTSGNLPSDWCNSLFFGSHAKDMMRSYLKHMRSKRYPGVDSQHWNEYSKAKTNP
ncbi:hypothetical protein FRC03_002868 [Tulasnella sp. 419]|nr:hypothetical protein FRC03_002868 [Tulasnella sp. 419]